jgi:hypothetical protein
MTKIVTLGQARAEALGIEGGGFDALGAFAKHEAVMRMSTSFDTRAATTAICAALLLGNRIELEHFGPPRPVPLEPENVTDRIWRENQNASDASYVKQFQRRLTGALELGHAIAVLGARVLYEAGAAAEPDPEPPEGAEPTELFDGHPDDEPGLYDTRETFEQDWENPNS